MINPQELDLSTLLWLPLDAKSAFPKQPAIYFAIDENGTVQYIGRSINVNKRWENHQKYYRLKELGSVKIAYLFIDEIELSTDIEQTLIEWFNPPLNCVYNSNYIPREEVFCLKHEYFLWLHSTFKPSEWMVYLYLKTKFPSLNDRFRLNTKYLSNKLGYHQRTVQQIIKLLVDSNLLLYYPHSDRYSVK
ncbi:MAG: GIY-YIG nuclease family protein [Crocosphaera sp.]|nr:GIY-YIG nuclease family protein [Crocosphaera sp.]